MIYLIDEDMPRSSAQVLGEKGYEGLDVRNIGLRGAPDKEIFERAIQINATIITADVGFASMVYLYEDYHSGIVLVRLPNYYKVNQINEILIASLDLLEEYEIYGNIVVIEPDRVRVRKIIN